MKASNGLFDDDDWDGGEDFSWVFDEFQDWWDQQEKQSQQQEGSGSEIEQDDENTDDWTDQDWLNWWKDQEEKSGGFWSDPSQEEDKDKQEGDSGDELFYEDECWDNWCDFEDKPEQKPIQPDCCEHGALNSQGLVCLCEEGYFSSDEDVENFKMCCSKEVEIDLSLQEDPLIPIEQINWTLLIIILISIGLFCLILFCGFKCGCCKCLSCLFPCINNGFCGKDSSKKRREKREKERKKREEEEKEEEEEEERNREYERKRRIEKERKRMEQEMIQIEEEQRRMNEERKRMYLYLPSESEKPIQIQKSSEKVSSTIPLLISSRKSIPEEDEVEKLQKMIMIEKLRAELAKEQIKSAQIISSAQTNNIPQFYENNDEIELDAMKQQNNSDLENQDEGNIDEESERIIVQCKKKKKLVRRISQQNTQVGGSQQKDIQIGVRKKKKKKGLGKVGNC
ncbi:MAG: hypothetical protein EZS28_018167 [Streblomastix strix]|uniref:Uncharacterized protein n=1 Tax=Streblomastix strix TaxID=222440 RepID=A0A5J4VUY9_9EUKA|nr:MAG: hypothetical protein EZS28_018167 [Streblomastix strix]